MSASQQTDDASDDSPSEEDLAVPEQEPIWVFWNQLGTITISQKGWPDDDALIKVQPENIPALSRKLLEVAGLAPAAVWPELLASRSRKAKSDGTAAERQRRYRRNKRNGGDTERDVTDRDRKRNGDAPPAPPE